MSSNSNNEKPDKITYAIVLVLLVFIGWVVARTEWDHRKRPNFIGAMYLSARDLADIARGRPIRD